MRSTDSRLTGTFRYATGYLLLAVVACSGGGQVESAEGGTKAVGSSTGGVGQGGALVSGKTIDPICVAGETQACLGPGQCAGAQVCGARGVSWGACDCGTGGTTSSMGGTTTSMGGTTSSSSTVPVTTTCGSAVAPTAMGSLSITGNYVTVGPLKGMGFTWMGSASNVGTCITPTCGASSCTPSFGTSAICAAGNVGADTTFKSVVGLGLNLNQVGTGQPGTVVMSIGVTVTVTKGSGTGDTESRIQITSGSTSWCVEAGSWTSGTLIPITSFNTTCWDTTKGTFATAGAAIEAVHVTVPSSDKHANPYSICITNISAS